MAYGTEVRSQAKALYETGNYSAKEVAAKLRKKCEKSSRLTERCIQSWIEKYDWKKGALEPTIQQRTEQSIIGLFAELGMPPDEVVKRVIEGIHAGADVVEKILAIATEQSKNGELPVNLELLELLKGYGAHLNTRAKFIELWAKLTGSFAPTDVNLKASDARISAEPSPDLSQLSDQELRTWIRLREKACGTASQSTQT
ncbi:MAG: hypothetical protein GF418_15970 [Chitinivibrionales bacterium]|nr:hypothetical protein [Chitinivibrionales bacterium]